MSSEHDTHGQNGHGGHSPHPMEWVDQHMGGLVKGFGERFEALAENLMFFIVNGILMRLAIFCLFLMTPVILVELVLHTVWF